MKQQEQQQIPEIINDITQKLVDTFIKIVQPFFNELVSKISVFEQKIAEIEKRVMNLSYENKIINEININIVRDIKMLYNDFLSRTKMFPYAVREHPEIKDFILAMDSKFRSVLKKAYYDNLTGLYNRNYLEEVLKTKKGTWIGFCLDIDHFKKINDTYGHSYGDSVLKDVAEAVKKIAVSSNHEALVFRLGGEEIGVLWNVRNFSRSTIDQEVAYIKEVTERIRNYIANNCKCTVSIGVSDKVIHLPLSEDADTLEVFKNIFGDKNLYAAKCKGRNKVCINENALIKSLLEEQKLNLTNEDEINLL